jgi:hypothetical protein
MFKHDNTYLRCGKVFRRETPFATDVWVSIKGDAVPQIDGRSQGWKRRRKAMAAMRIASFRRLDFSGSI